MFELIRKKSPKRRTGGFVHGVKDMFGTHDPKHVEATKGIKRVEAF